MDDRFFKHDSPEAAGAWDALKNRLPVDSAVEGTVYAKANFGAWIDLGVGFPALLEIIYAEGLMPERYQAGEWCPVGSKVRAMVLGYREDARQVYLWQRKPASTAG
jgi:ribosomal protein S1